MSLKPYLIIIFLLSSCSYIPFGKKNIDSQKIIEVIKKSDIHNKEFSQFLISKGFNSDELPFKDWGLKELISAQQFFNPQLKSAKMQLEFTQANEAIASLYPPSSIGLKIGRETTNKELTKKIFGSGFSFTFESADKRLIRHELALNKSQLALVNFQLTKWNLRIELFNKLFNFIENQEFIKLTKTELRLAQSVMNMVRKRLEAGIASQIDLDRKTIMVNKINKRLLELQMNQSIMRNQIASLIGLNTQKFNLIPIDSKKITSILDDITILYLKDKKLLVLQEISLTKRLDLRKVLSNYAIAEAELKLEVAEQYPDYTFSPAYAYEFGTKLWSLGINSILKSTDRNKAFINKAEKFRDLEASKVSTLQLSAINDIQALQLNFSNKFEDLKYSNQMIETKNRLESQLTARFEEGLINRMEYENEKINLIDISKNHHKAIYNLIRIGLIAESVLQEPIFTPNLNMHNEK
jgi:cobalt-zinc-cadmium efflux system outer membrane protein